MMPMMMMMMANQKQGGNSGGAKSQELLEAFRRQNELIAALSTDKGRLDENDTLNAKVNQLTEKLATKFSKKGNGA
jgi:hypothetical protein